MNVRIHLRKRGGKPTRSYYIRRRTNQTHHTGRFRRSLPSNTDYNLVIMIVAILMRIVQWPRPSLTLQNTR